MAYMDPMGNYSNYDDYTDYSAPVAPVMPAGMETEEERRKRELEERKRAEKEARRADETAVQEQKVITYENGSKTIETKQEVPAGSKGPVSPTDYNQRIAQQESGARPDIGFHDRNKSSAYGTYGMTSAGYEDARRVNPNLPADITQATPDQQTQAQTAYTQQNAKYLQNYGVEPNENTLAAAHFLGAKGLSDYLKTGYISEAAAKANGGAENVRRIVDQRLGGQAAAASGAAQRPQPVQPVAPQAQAQPTAQAPVAPVSPEQAQAQPQAEPSSMYSLAKPQAQPTSSAGFIDRYQTAQNDPAALMKLGTDENVPDMLRDRARNRAADLITQQREQAKAQQDLATKTPSDLARLMTERKKDGSWAKYILFGALGMTALRDEESTKLGIGTDKIVTGADGKGYLIKMGANGAPIEGFNDQGKALTPEELITAAAGGVGKWQTSAEFFQDKAGNVYQTQHNDKGQVRTVDTKTGAVYSGKEQLERLRDTSKLNQMGIAQGYRRENMTTEQANRLNNMQVQLTNDLTKAKAKDRLNIFSDYNKALVAEGLPTLTTTEMGLNPDGTLASERAQVPQAAAPVAPQTQTAPSAAPVSPGTPLMAALQAAAPTQAVAPGAPAMAAPTQAQPVAGARPTLAELQKQKEIEKSAREVAETGAKEESKKLADMRIALPKTERATAATLATIDDVLKHPGFSDVIGMPNILTGIWSAPTTDARNFKTKYEQLKGKAFMEAYNGLRGTGSISEAEGMRAETAIAALNDPYISEKEFIRNAEIFKNTMRNGIDNERIQIGQEPRYTKFTADEKSAFEWLKKNPNDPRADETRLYLERKLPKEKKEK
jgi:hypothetical protein